MYYYDIYLCFDDNYKNFYNWSKDLIERFLKVKIIRVDNILPFIINDIKIDYSDGIYLLSDTINALAIDIKNNKIVGISSLLLNDEIEVVKLSHSLDITQINIQINGKKRIENYSNEEKIPIKVLSLDIKNGSDDFIKYLYYYIFNKKSNNIKNMRSILLKDIKNNFNDNYLKLYKIIYK